MQFQAQGGTASDERLTVTTDQQRTRPPPVAASWSTRFEYPRASMLRRGFVWEHYSATGPDLERMAYHEAGHGTLLEWLGLGCPKATATAHGGLTHLPDTLPETTDPDDPTGILTASAAAVFHAGTMAEMIYTGTPWRGPVFRPLTDDHQRAERMLKPVFGSCSSGAHAYAQRLALYVLIERWARVGEIAQRLIQTGEWRPA